ncbi:MAG: cyclase family protein [Bacteroidales bacterium]|nr:cyclase family protein [Bacteroidales bacterium]
MKFRIVDLTHELSSDMPVFPGDSAPEIEALSAHDKDGCQELELRLTTHTGTHIDCPRHLLQGMMSLSSFDVGFFYGKAITIDCSAVKDEIPLGVLQPYHHKLNRIDFILFYTGHDKWWGRKEYFVKFPVLTQEAAGYLTRFRIRGVGFDAVSADRIDSTDLPVHNIILKKNILIIENLTALKNVLDMDFYFSCFPLKIRDGDGSPVRAVAYLKEE